MFPIQKIHKLHSGSASQSGVVLLRCHWDDPDDGVIRLGMDNFMHRPAQSASGGIFRRATPGAEKLFTGAPHRPVHEVVHAEQINTIIRIMPIVRPIIPLAFQPYLLLNFSSRRVHLELLWQFPNFIHLLMQLGKVGQLLALRELCSSSGTEFLPLVPLKTLPFKKCGPLRSGVS